MTLTREQYGLLSMDVHNRGRSHDPEGGWAAATDVGDLIAGAQFVQSYATPDFLTDSFFAATYKIGNDVVLVFRGTDNQEIDEDTGWGIGTGGYPIQADLAIRAGRAALDALNPGETLTVAGHSLGGGLTGLVAKRKRLYEGYGFMALPSNPLRLFLPIATVRALLP